MLVHEVYSTGALEGLILHTDGVKSEHLYNVYDIDNNFGLNSADYTTVGPDSHFKNSLAHTFHVDTYRTC